MSQRKAYVPHGVIPAVLLPFDNDLAIDEASFRKHLRDVASVEGLSAITLPEPDSSPLQPSTKDENSHELCVVSTFTGRGRFCRVRMCHS